MPRFDGSLALKLDFGRVTTKTVPAAAGHRGLRLATASREASESGTEQYRALAHRRHQAQMKARRLLDLLD